MNIKAVVGSTAGLDSVVKKGVRRVSEVELQRLRGIGDTDDPVTDFKQAEDERSS